MMGRILRLMAILVPLSLLVPCLSAFGLDASFAPFSITTHRFKSNRMIRLKGRQSDSYRPTVCKAKDAGGYGDDGVLPNINREDNESTGRRDFFYNAVAVGLLGVSGVASYSLFQGNVYTPSGFKRLPRTQFIAALGDPNASSGEGADSWGLWELDPGPRGVWLKDYQKEILQSEVMNQAPAGWMFDPNNWWLEEHGLIMEAPKFPLTPGRYLVTGGRMVTTGLTVDQNGRWKLDEGRLYDVTHLPCRSAVYHPINSGVSGSGGTPAAANPKDFPVAPGATMPFVEGCTKQDYAVLFVVGKAF